MTTTNLRQERRRVEDKHAGPEMAVSIEVLVDENGQQREREVARAPILTGAERLQELENFRFILVRNLASLAYKKPDGSPLLMYVDTLTIERPRVWETCLIHETQMGWVIDDGTAEMLMNKAASGQQGGAQMNQQQNGFQGNVQQQSGFQGAAGQQGGFQGAPNNQQAATAQQAAQAGNDAAPATGRKRKSAGSAVANPGTPPPPSNPDSNNGGFAPNNQGQQMNGNTQQNGAGFQGNNGAGFQGANGGFQGGGNGAGFQGNAGGAGFQGNGQQQNAAPANGPSQGGFQGAPQNGGGFNQNGFQGRPNGGFQGGGNGQAQGQTNNQAAAAPAPSVDLTPVMNALAGLQASAAKQQGLLTQILAAQHHIYSTAVGFGQNANVATLQDFQNYLTPNFTGPLNP